MTAARNSLLTSPVASDGSSGHAGDEFQHGRPARASVNLFAFAALLLEVIAFIIVIPILTTQPAFSCFSGPYRQWVTPCNFSTWPHFS
jgi:hypothetical protein